MEHHHGSDSLSYHPSSNAKHGLDHDNYDDEDDDDDRGVAVVGSPSALFSRHKSPKSEVLGHFRKLDERDEKSRHYFCLCKYCEEAYNDMMEKAKNASSDEAAAAAYDNVEPPAKIRHSSRDCTNHLKHCVNFLNNPEAVAGLSIKASSSTKARYGGGEPRMKKQKQHLRDYTAIGDATNDEYDEYRIRAANQAILAGIFNEEPHIRSAFLLLATRLRSHRLTAQKARLSEWFDTMYHDRLNGR